MTIRLPAHRVRKLLAITVLGLFLISFPGDVILGKGRPFFPDRDLETAERLYDEGRLPQAIRAFRKMASRRWSEADRTWIDFRLADIRWRLEVAKNHPDEDVIDSARESLEKLLHGLPSSLKQLRIFAELDESLGTLWLHRPKREPFWDHIQRARPCLTEARRWWFQRPNEPYRNARFLRLFWLSQEDSLPEWSLPIDEMREALVLHRSDDEGAHLHLMIAKTLASKPTPTSDDVIHEYEQGLALGITKWRQALLFGFGNFMRYCGRQEPTRSGRLECRPDNERALAIFEELKKDIAGRGSESTYYVDQEIDRIAKAEARTWIPGFFLPGDPIEFTLLAKNVKLCKLVLYQLEFARDFRPQSNSYGAELRWLETLPLDGRTPIRRWTEEIVSPVYEQVQRKIRLEPLPASAYLVQVRSDGGESRSLLIVSDLAVLLTRAGGRSALLVTRARSGAAVETSDIKVFQGTETSGWVSTPLKSAGHGLAVLPDKELSGLILATEGPNIALLGLHMPQESGPSAADVYTFTEKSVYNAGDKVSVSFVARTGAGFVSTTPGRTLAYEVRSGEALVTSGVVSLDSQGCGHVLLPLRNDAAAGIYGIRFPAFTQRDSVLERSLFRVAERVPGDLHVEVKASRDPEEGSDRSLRVHVKVEKEKQPVDRASVELTLIKRVFEPGERLRRIDRLTQAHWRTLKGTTDASGGVQFTFPPQAIPSCNFEYEIEAMARGGDGEKGFGRGRIRVGTSPYFARLSLDRHVARPGESVRATVTTLDADGNPIRTGGYLNARRQVWTEAWKSPDGREINGDELRRLKARGGPFPPEKGWKPLRPAWSFETASSVPVRTDAAGKAIFEIPARVVGRLELRFESREDAGQAGDAARLPVTAWYSQRSFPVGGEATLWVINDATTDSGYQPDSLEIHLSKETALPGGNVTALIVTPLKDRDVLLTVSSRTDTEHSVIHVDGNVKPVQLRFPEDGSEKLSVAAAMVSEGLVFQCQKDLVLDPDALRLQVDVYPIENVFQGGMLTIRLTDLRGRPVRGEISAVLLEGEDEPLADPLTDLLKQPPSYPYRETSLTRWPMAGSGAGTDGPIQPQCSRRKEWIVGHGEVPCELTSSESRRYDLERISSFEAEVPGILFHTEGLPTNENGEAAIKLLSCTSSRGCRLRVWAIGSGHTFGLFEEKPK